MTEDEYRGMYEAAAKDIATALDIPYNLQFLNEVYDCVQQAKKDGYSREEVIDYLIKEHK